MSPGSVAHFLDAGSIAFDLVIFDEASQIRVPQSIGAMGRGKAVVVVGDSRQMPPTRIMEVDTTASEAAAGLHDAMAVEDLESILSEAVESGLRPGVADLALPQPGREPDRLLERAVLRRPSGQPALAGRRTPATGLSAGGGSTASSIAAGARTNEVEATRSSTRSWPGSTTRRPRATRSGWSASTSSSAT